MASKSGICEIDVCIENIHSEKEYTSTKLLPKDRQV